jgi:hypothetical protein
VIINEQAGYGDVMIVSKQGCPQIVVQKLIFNSFYECFYETPYS